jgi:hypothetical protein
MPHLISECSFLLLVSAATGCGSQGSAKSAEPAPQASTAELSGKVFVTGSEPSTTVILVQKGGPSVNLLGELDPELRRLSGSTLRVRGARRGEPPAGGFEVESYQVLEVDGEVPEVGVLQESDGGLWLAGRDTVELASPPAALRQQPGAKVWIVGRRMGGKLGVQSYGIIREPAR